MQLSLPLSPSLYLPSSFSLSLFLSLFISLSRWSEREREKERDKVREREREREREKEGERELLFLFLKGMMGALAPFSILVSRELALLLSDSVVNNEPR